MCNFNVIPAIDLKNGKCVRLSQGRADQTTVYADDPVGIAQHWVAQGATALHVVDLDGAFAGTPKHLQVIHAIIAAIAPIPVQIGGGLREDADMQAAIDAGAARIIIGTRALKDFAQLHKLTALYGNKLAVGIDARGGLVQIQGWTETTAMKAVELAKRAEQAGVRTIIYTDTATDGMLQGPNCAAMAELSNTVTCNVIASGGVAGAEHVAQLANLRLPNLIGVIVGKALYEQTVSLAELLTAAKLKP